ncbi:MAG TPA: hypothetical protein VIX37_14810 [Candidatus Sulfotelmatobacter sp.]
MPFALLSIGILLIVVAVRNRQTEFVQTVKSDFTGPGNFMYWVVALVIVGAIGYIPKAKPVADLFIVLILIVLLLKRGNSSGVGGGVFQQLNTALGMTTASPGTTGTTATVTLPSVNF